MTTASFVPSQLHLLAREVLALYSTAQIQAGAAPCASLKRVLSGGEALTSAAAADITAALPHCQLWNTYGPTETTVGEPEMPQLMQTEAVHVCCGSRLLRCSYLLSAESSPNLWHCCTRNWLRTVAANRTCVGVCCLNCSTWPCRRLKPPRGTTVIQSLYCLLQFNTIAHVCCCHAGIASWLYDPATAGCSNTVPIGRGIHNSRLYVLDSALQPVPIGVPGQLFLSGHGVSAGYLNRPELNATTFVPNPFSCYEKPGSNTELMYRTGRDMRGSAARLAAANMVFHLERACDSRSDATMCSAYMSTSSVDHSSQLADQGNSSGSVCEGAGFSPHLAVHSMPHCGTGQRAAEPESNALPCLCRRPCPLAAWPP